jgi:hypothetical protein
MQMHALLPVFGSGLAVISSFKPSFLLCLDYLKVLGAVFDVVEPLFLDALSLGLAVAATKARALAIAVEVETGHASSVDMARGLVIHLSAMGAAILHGASPALVMRWMLCWLMPLPSRSWRVSARASRASLTISQAEQSQSLCSREPN